MPHTIESRRAAARQGKTWPVSDVIVQEGVVVIRYANGWEDHRHEPVDIALKFHGAGARAIWRWRQGLMSENEARAIARLDCT